MGLIDRKQDCFYTHGFFIGVAYLPYAIYTGNWIWFVARCVILALFMGLWCKFFKNDIVEETGRGFALIASLPLLLI